jgi:hypothetical protein
MFASARPFSAPVSEPRVDHHLIASLFRWVLSDHDLGVGPKPRQQPQHFGFGHRNAPGGGTEVLPRQMQEDRAASARDSRRGVVIDLDDEIIEVILSLEQIASRIAVPAHRPVVMAALRVFAPGVFSADSANWEPRPRPWVPIGAPPQSARPECAFRGAAIAFALVGANSPASERYRHGSTARGQPASPWIACRRRNADRGQRPISKAHPARS